MCAPMPLFMRAHADETNVVSCAARTGPEDVPADTIHVTCVPNAWVDMSQGAHSPGQVVP
jgi:hypothetical protein